MRRSAVRVRWVAPLLIKDEMKEIEIPLGSRALIAPAVSHEIAVGFERGLCLIHTRFRSSGAGKVLLPTIGVADSLVAAIRADVGGIRG